jgi:hypothetical protein
MVAEESGNYVCELWDNYQSQTNDFRRRIVDYYKQYIGVPNRQNYSGMANVFVNETLEAVETIVAQEEMILNSEPKPVMLLGREETDQENAEVNEELMCYYLDQMNYRQKRLQCSKYRIKYGTVFGKLSWQYEEKTMNFRVRQPDGNIGMSSGRHAVKDHPKLQLLDILDCAYEPGKGSVEDMKWFIIRKRVDWDYIKGMERKGLYSSQQVEKIDKSLSKSHDYLNQKKQRLAAIGITDLGVDDEYEILETWITVPRWWVTEETEAEDAQEMVEAVIEVLYPHKITLRLEENPYWHKEKPVLMAHYLQVDDEANGVGVCQIAERLQQELNDKRNQLLDHASLQIRPPLIRNSTSGIDKADIKFEPNHVIDSNMEPDRSIGPMKIGGNPFENVTTDQVVKQDIRNNTGATNPVQGIGSNKDTTATEIATLERRGGSRINVSTMDFGEKFLKRMFRLLYKLMQQFVPMEKAVRIVGKEGMKWVKVTPEQLIHEYDIIPRIPTDIESRTIMRNQLIQFLGTVAQSYPQVNAYKLVKRIYGLFGFNDVEQIVPEPPTERGQQDISMQQEIMVLSMGQKIDVKYYDNHLQKLAVLSQFLMENQANMSPQALAAFQDKIQQHTKYLQALEQMMATMGEQPGGQRPAPRKGAVPAGRPRPAPVAGTMMREAMR